jgi:hypothetical protein
VGVDSMDIHLSEHGTTTADKVHEREEFRMLVGDIQSLPETQRTALVLREMDALSYEQIAEAMETTVPSVKSLLVRARVSLAEAAQARMLTCEEVRVELGEVAEGLRRRPGALVRRHLRTCERCSTFKSQLNDTSKALAALLPIGLGPMMLLRKLAILHLGHGASAGAGSSASGASAAGQAAAVGSTAAAGASAVMGTTGSGFLSASVGAIATKAAAGLAAAALVTAGAVEVDQKPASHPHAPTHAPAATHLAAVPTIQPTVSTPTPPAHLAQIRRHAVTHSHKPKASTTAATTQHKTPKPLTKHDASTTAAKTTTTPKTTTLPGRTQTQTAATVLPTQTTTAAATTTPTTACTDTGSSTSTTTTTSPAASSDPGTGTGTGTTTSTPTDTTSTGTTSTPTTTPSPAPDTTTTQTPTTPATSSASDSSCASDSAGSSGSTQPASSGGAAP